VVVKDGNCIRHVCAIRLLTYSCAVQLQYSVVCGCLPHLVGEPSIHQVTSTPHQVGQKVFSKTHSGPPHVASTLLGEQRLQPQTTLTRARLVVPLSNKPQTGM
jgi:hypothetical protein